MRLLIAEDDARNLDMLARRLRRRGHEVLAAADGLAAVEITLRETPDLVLMDLAMPGLSSWDAIARIRAAGQTLPIVVLSAHSLGGERERALAMGAQAYLSKPVDFEALLATLDQLKPS